MKIQEANTKEQISSCFPVMRELRPHLNVNSFLEAVVRMKLQGYRLIFLADPEVRAVAGFRKIEMLAMGTVLYVDDLVTSAPHRSKGYGKQMLNWLSEEAKRQHCQYFELDSGVKRLDAHRFYETNGMQKAAFHFSIPAIAEKPWAALP
jgi:GNAT superfamily N-acetyltransferase